MVYGFPRFVGPGTIKIKVRMENPEAMADITGDWEYKSWYEYEDPFNKLITYGSDD